ncbi:MAG: glycosyltransferase family 2 protein [Acidobacteriaceae bacterium]
MDLDWAGQSSSQASPTPSCTVVVCTRRRPSQLRQCLQSLQRLHYPDCKVLVVENDGDSGEAEEIAASYGNLYRLCTRRGLSAARNLAVNSCNTELLAFIDDDATCDPDWLRHSASLFLDPTVHAVTGKIAFHPGGGFASIPSYEFDPGHRTVGYETPDWFGMAVFGGLGRGSNFLVRRSALQRLGGFDERLGRGTFLHASEENIFLFRVIDAGFRVASSSRSCVHHPVCSTGVDESPFRAIAASTAIVAMVAVEHPRYLFKLASYIWGAIRRKPQPWRHRPARLFEGMASPWEVYAALLSGPFIYLAAAIRYLLEGTPHFAAMNANLTPEEFQPETAAPKMRA